MIRFFFENTKPSLKKRNILRNYINYIISEEGYKTGDIAVVFCDDAYLLEINRKYLKHDYYTDIITFDQSAGKMISGDLFISVDRVKENADIFKVTYKEELNRVIFHGVLHLLGYDDKDVESREMMRGKENYYLNKMNIHE